MAIDRKLNQGITQLRDAVATTISGTTLTRTTTETWTGPYSRLKTKQEANWNSATSTNLAPAEADTGVLTLVFEEKLEVTSKEKLPDSTTEVIWQELRLPVTQHPAFKDLDIETVKTIRLAAETEGATPPEGVAEGYLYNLLAAGVTEYATGVPVVRRNSTRRSGSTGGGNAWTRGNPPVSVPGTWDFLKTADERREDGNTFTQVEEWTGAKEWDEILYP